MARRNVEKFMASNGLLFAGTCQAIPKSAAELVMLAGPEKLPRVSNWMPASPTALGVSIWRPPSAASGSLNVTV